MHFKKYLLILLLFHYGNSFACKCREFEKETMVERGLDDADIVFYGELIKSDSLSQTFTFKIIELFKGNFNSASISGKTTGSNCSVYPSKKGLWIVYANLSKDSIIDISMCSPSQSMDFGIGYPPPPFLIKVDGKWVNPNETEVRLFELEQKNKSLCNFIYQLEKLRQYKLDQNSLTNEMKANSKDKIMTISLIVNAILLLTVIFLIVSKKNSNNRITK